MANRPYQRCARCIMDTSDPDIRFDEKGYCNHCTEGLATLRRVLLPSPQREEVLARLVERIRRDGRGKEYDCIIGLSGGVDSSTVAYRVKQLGLRPLAVHFDNGWDSEVAVDNIRNIVKRLGFDLYTCVVDWEEFRDLQKSFLMAGVPNAEIPTDHAIRALLYRVAHAQRLSYIISGGNLSTELILPRSWGHDNNDLYHLRAIHRRFGTRPLKTTPLMGAARYLRYILVHRIRWIMLLNYYDYDREEAKRLLAEELGWRDYGEKHWESVWTRFFQGYYLPRKFGFDKRLAHLSSMICSGKITRDEALARLKTLSYPEELLEQDRQFVMKKFGFSEAEFEALMTSPPRRHTDYPNSAWARSLLSRIKRRFVSS